MPADTTAADFSFLDLPDDELANHQPPPVVKTPTEGEGEGTGEDKTKAAGGNEGGGAAADEAAAQAAKDAEDAAAAAAKAAEAEAARLAAEEAAAGTKPAAKEPTAEETAAAEAAAAAAAAGEGKPNAETKPVEKPAEAPAIDYKAEYERVMAPFKANGRDITPANVDDVVQLMQMGANYSKKMAALKPNLTLLKMLETNGLLSEEKIGFLIDLSKKDPGAINKLVRESGLDPLDLGGDKATEYKPGAHKVDPREMELDAVLDELQTTPTYPRILEILTKEFDAPSKQVIADQPGLIREINRQVQAGIYDLIDTEIARERAFGRLQGLSFLQAYKQVGDAIHARGGFNHLVSGQGNSKPAAQVIQPDPAKAAAEEEAKKKKLAAAPAKPAASGGKALPADFNPLALSDEDFAKLGDPKHI